MPYLIRAPSLGHAHESVVKYILEKGYSLTTEDNELTLETDTITIYVDRPFTEPMTSPCSRFPERFNIKYAEDLLCGTPSEFEYDYHKRLFKWECDGIPVDQIEHIVEKLRKERVSRRAMAITWNPRVDPGKKDVPCLQLIQCLLRPDENGRDRLHMRVVFRSNDMLSALGSNMYGLVSLQAQIALDVGDCIVGSYTHVSLIPHVYYKRDLSDIPRFCDRGNRIQPHAAVCMLCDQPCSMKG
jgi:thymidylate synthase